MDNLIGSLKDAGLCKDVHYKELYIPQAELEGEQSFMLHKVTMMFTACFPASHQGNLLIAPAVLWMQDMPTVTPPCDIDHLFQAN